jgi:hypothetical protein
VGGKGKIEGQGRAWRSKRGKKKTDKRDVEGERYYYQERFLEIWTYVCYSLVFNTKNICIPVGI